MYTSHFNHFNNRNNLKYFAKGIDNP